MTCFATSWAPPHQQQHSSMLQREKSNCVLIFLCMADSHQWQDPGNLYPTTISFSEVLRKQWENRSPPCHCFQSALLRTDKLRIWTKDLFGLLWFNWKLNLIPGTSLGTEYYIIPSFQTHEQVGEVAAGWGEENYDLCDGGLLEFCFSRFSLPHHCTCHHLPLHYVSLHGGRKKKQSTVTIIKVSIKCPTCGEYTVSGSKHETLCPQCHGMLHAAGWHTSGANP